MVESSSIVFGSHHLTSYLWKLIYGIRICKCVLYPALKNIVKKAGICYWGGWSALIHSLGGRPRVMSSLCVTNKKVCEGWREASSVVRGSDCFSTGLHIHMAVNQLWLQTLGNLCPLWASKGPGLQMEHRHTWRPHTHTHIFTKVSVVMLD